MTPPTYSPWLNPFERLARLGFWRSKPSLGNLQVGDPASQADVAGGAAWNEVAKSAALHAAWGPPAASDWSPYHRPTLFAAFDALSKPAFPAPPAPGFQPRPEPLVWARRDRAIILDLPGEVSVAYAAALARLHGYQPVVTFNNWPHEKGLVDMRAAMAALLHFVPWVRDQRIDGPPVFVLDCRRFGFRGPHELDFDNRYFLLEADLPSGPQLVRHGITEVVYVRPPPATEIEPPKHLVVSGKAEMDHILGLAATPPTPRLVPSGTARRVAEEEDDLNAWLCELPKHVELQIARAALDGWGAEAPVRFRPAARKTVFNTVKDPAFAGFRRSAAGGFGAMVPEASSGG